MKTGIPARGKIQMRYRGRLLKLMTRETRLPNGHRVLLEMVKHPGAALVVPFLTRDRIILLRQLRLVINRYIYELPAGTIDSGESPLACARREIREETGYSASKFTRLGKIYPVPGYSTERIFIYRAEGLEKTTALPEKDEVIRVRVVTRREIVRLFEIGRITDAKTICALCFCGWL